MSLKATRRRRRILQAGFYVQGRIGVFALWMLVFALYVIPFFHVDIMGLIPKGTNKQETR